MKKILIIGANGQIGTDLTIALRQKYGYNNVLTSDIREPKTNDSFFVLLDATDRKSFKKFLESYQIEEVYLLAAILSANAEKMPLQAWDVNMRILFNALELTKEGYIKKLFWPSSIAVFGLHTPPVNTPQYTIMDPNTVYGISKLAGERWIEYYNEHYNLDIRSVRYPGILSWRTSPGGGTTDYAVEIFHEILKNNHYTSFLTPHTRLPMMYMPDAIEATIKIMEADKSSLSLKTSYNISGISFTPKELVDTIKKYFSDFTVDYQPDFRQTIAESWPENINDDYAFKDWHWQHKYDLDAMVKDMLKNLYPKYHKEEFLNF